MEINGFYDLKTKQNTFLICDCWKYDGDAYSARILCNEHYTNPVALVDYITKDGAHRKISEDGLFMAVVCYKDRLYIFADAATSQWVMYYTITGDKLFYSSSLKSLLKESGIHREMDLSAAKGFLKSGIVMGSSTLVSGVNKLDVGEMLIVKNGSVKSKRIKYISSICRSDADLLTALKDSIERYTSQDQKVFMPLSAGYDSNMILNTVAKSNHTIEAFTIGGDTGKNEIPIVEKNIRLYDRINHHTELANQSLFKKLPEIIWRLDGYVYERGIFLQYLLADLVARNGGKTFICGECSDEHQSLLYQKDMKRRQSHNISPLETMDWMLQPYAWGNFVVLKKSALMLNSFGIQGCYPFATKRFTDIAISLGSKNLDKKALYIELLKDELPIELYEGLFHAGGSTSVNAIISDEDRAVIREKIENSELIQKIKSNTKICNKPFWMNYAELYLSEKGNNNFSVIIGYLKYLAKIVLSKMRLYSKVSEPIEDSLETDIKAYYLILFYELFIFGNTSLLSNTE